MSSTSLPKKSSEGKVVMRGESPDVVTMTTTRGTGNPAKTGGTEKIGESIVVIVMTGSPVKIEDPVRIEALAKIADLVKTEALVHLAKIVDLVKTEALVHLAKIVDPERTEIGVALVKEVNVAMVVAVNANNPRKRRT